MNLNIITRNEQKIAEIQSGQIEISNVQDALDLMANSDYLGARSAILYEKNIAPDFFDLKTKLAGEILQKFVNYGFRVAIIGVFENFMSNALKAFILECNRGNHIFFVKDLKTALNKMT